MKYEANTRYSSKILTSFRRMDCRPKLTPTAPLESHSDRSVYLSALSTSPHRCKCALPLRNTRTTRHVWQRSIVMGNEYEYIALF